MTELKNDIFYVGVKDPALRVFDIIMETEYGTTYNAYLVKGEKNALIECVHEKLTDKFIKNIEEIMPVSEIDYMVCNHSEPDHSGAVKRILEMNPDIEVVGSIAAIKNLKEITNTAFNEKIAKEGMEIDLGKGKVMKFYMIPNLHWPDTMVTYIESDKTLFTCDAFGAHYCEDTITDEGIIYYDRYEKAMKFYYDCIVSPFKPFVLRAIEKLSALEYDIVCTSHGPVLKKYIGEALRKYKEWSTPIEKAKKTAAVFYVSAYGYTAKMAEAVCEAIKEKDWDVNCIDLSSSCFEDVKYAADNADAMVFGTPTINRNAVKPVYDVILSIDLVNKRNTPCMVFGSYGWSGEGIQYVATLLETLKMKVFDKPFGCLFNPSEENLSQLKEYTGRFIDFV